MTPLEQKVSELTRRLSYLESMVAKELFSTADIGKMVGKSQRWVQIKIKQRGIKGQKVGQTYRYDRNQIYLITKE